MKEDNMKYCYDKNLPWPYSKNEMKLVKQRGNGILYDSELHRFEDFDHNEIDITGEVIFPRTGVAQIYDLLDEIVRQGGTPAFSKDEMEQVRKWPKYVQTKRTGHMLTGKDLLDEEVIERLEQIYGTEFFMKTLRKDFSGIIPIELLKDKECAFYKTLVHHPDTEFFISEKVNIEQDQYGKKEYRCFVVDGEIYNISRFTSRILHEIDPQVLEKLQNIVASLKGSFPKNYVLDVFEYELNGEKDLDVLEFNSIDASGLYLYNSCIEKSDDLLHKNPRHVATEFVSVLEECTSQGQITGDAKNLYSIPDTFSNDLSCMCVVGMLGARVFDAHISPEDFGRHVPIFNIGKFVNPVKFDDDLARHPVKEKKM